MTERVQQTRRKAPLPQRTPEQMDVPVTMEPLAVQRQALTRHGTRPQTAQRHAAGPVLRAASLDRQEHTHLEQERGHVQRQVAALGEVTTVGPQADPRPVPDRPTTPAEWVTVMRARVEEVQGQPLDSRSSTAFTSLQRQVAQTLAQGFRADRGDAQARYATYGEHLATLQRHPVSAPVARVVLGLIPPAERLPLQRAVDETLQRFQAQEQAALNFNTLQTLQRQLAELDAEATQPVLARIQARRGSGNPLPEAIQRHLEQGLNHDLSRVRIHDDAEADKLAKGVNAIAFTTGTDIFFQAGRFNPNTQSGLELLAHEVTHTVQQSQGRVGTGIDPDAGLESEARRMGAQLAGAGPIRQTDSRLKPLAPAVSLRGLQRAPGSAADIAKWRKRLDSLNKELALDLTAAAADVAGLVDPTPISDGISAAISLARGDWLGAGLSIVSMIPGLGDAIAKPIKGSKLAAKIAKLEQEIRVVTAQLAKLTGRPLAAVEAAAKASRKVVANEVLGRLPKNWPNVRGILGKKFDPRHLPAGYHVRTVGGKPVISRNKGLSDDDLYAPLTIDSKGNFALKTTSARLSNPTTMRNNYTRVYGPLKPGHQIHHLVPDNLMRDHALGQAAQRAGVDLDRARNLMGLPGKEAYRTGGDAGHWSSHPEFDLVVTKRMDKLTADLEKQFGSLDLVPRRIMQQTMDTLADQLRTLIKSGAAPMKDGRLSAVPHLRETVA